MKNFKYILFILILSSCAGYKYNNSSSDKSIQITSNVDNIVAFEKDNKQTNRPYLQYNNDSKSSIYTYKYDLNSLKRRKNAVYITKENYDTVKLEIKKRPRTEALIRDFFLGVPTLMTPFVVDAFRSDFYKIRETSKSQTVNLKFNQKFMNQEFEKIKESSKPDDFIAYLKVYPYSKLANKALDKKDSTELLIAVDKSTEKAIDDYIASHKTSKFKVQAETIKKQIVEARTAFDKEKTVNTVEGYEAYLKKYPYSLQRKEAHARLVDAAEKVAFENTSLTKQLNFCENYLFKYGESLDETSLKAKTKRISLAIDNQIITENNPKKIYNYQDYKNVWSVYVEIKNKFEGKLESLEKTDAYRNKISKELLAQFSKLSNETKQKEFLQNSELDFPNLSDTKQPLIVTLFENSLTKNGTYKLYNLGYFDYVLKNSYEGNPIKGKDFVEYQGKNYPVLTGLNYEEYTYVNDKLTQTRLFNNKTNLLDLKYYDDWTKLGEASYYLNGQLVKTEYTPNRNTYYFYEFQNGVNITLQDLESKISMGDAALANQDFNRAIDIYTNDCKNNFPSNLPQNIRLNNAINKANNQKYAYEQKMEKERIAQERIAQEENNKRQAYDPENGVLKYKKYIKDKIYAMAGLEVMFGKNASDEELKVMVSYLEDKLNRKLTKYDHKVIIEIGKEVEKEIILVDQMSKLYGGNSNSTVSNSGSQIKKNETKNNTCYKCSKPQKFKIWKSYGNSNASSGEWKIINETRLGMIKCTCCDGYGVNWSFNSGPVSKDCYCNSCEGGWTRCDVCRGSGTK
jgi:hypothetical protein